MTDMTPAQITKALEAGIISEAQANTMRAKAGVAESDLSHLGAQIGNEDEMRFLRSFSDVFISIGVGIFGFGLSVVAGLFGGGTSFLFAAAVMWRIFWPQKTRTFTHTDDRFGISYICSARRSGGTGRYGIRRRY